MHLLLETSFRSADLASALGMDEARLVELFRTNGRLLSFLITPILAARLGYRELRGDNAPACLIDDEGGHYLVRTATKNSGVNFAPQYMKGYGRHFDHGEFLDHVDKYAGFILVDATAFPLIQAFRVNAGEVRQMDLDGELRDGSINFSAFRHRANGGLGTLV